MKKVFAFHLSPRAAGLTLAAVACLAFGLASSPAGAEQCPRGQIFWKSKKTCVDKAEAAKLGFYHGPVPAQDKASDKASDKAEPETPVEEEPGAAAVTPPEPDPASVQPAAAEAPKPSPYGELVLEEFAKTK